MALSVPRFLPTKSYLFGDLRHALAASGLQPGVMALGATTEFKVVQRAAGANMSVDISAGDSGAWVGGLDTTRQGAYHVYNDAAVNVSVSAANATNPRIDQVVLRVYDTLVIGGGTDAAALEVIAGTATAGATLDNRTGAANLATIAAPKSLIRLADVLVPAASSSVVTANIRDRRPWARGAFVTKSRTAGNITTNPGATAVTLAQADLESRVECTGVPLRLTLSAGVSLSTLDFVVTGVRMDGGAPTGFTDPLDLHSSAPPATTASPRGWSFTFTPTAGSHLLTPIWRTTNAGSTIALSASATAPLLFTIEEIVRQNTANA